ncbi:MAG TPA: CU044_5270 family protein [Streptosporangiaceae bacterium]|nr:CU044_5270 family protein [Streptosporangiaceae bacterium]
MTDLLEPEAPRELKEMRAGITGRSPEELDKARALLFAEIHGERPARPARLAQPPRSARPRRWVRPALVAGTAVAAAAIVVSLLPGGKAQLPGGKAQRTSQPAALTAAYVLDRAASAAAATAQPVPRPDQYIYVTSVTMYVSSELGNGPEKSWLYRTRRQIWQSADGTRTGLLQIVQQPNKKLPWGPTPPALSGNPVDWLTLPPLGCPGAAPVRGTYTFLASLPTDPARLRDWLYRHPDGQNPADAQAWTDIGDMLREMLVPPRLAAALFRVAATIPGATVVQGAANAIGQTGVAVSRSGSELIFGSRTYQLIGERSVLTRPVAGMGPAGTVVASTAQLKEAVVSTLPDVPKSQQDNGGPGPDCRLSRLLPTSSHICVRYPRKHAAASADWHRSPSVAVRRLRTAAVTMTACHDERSTACEQQGYGRRSSGS